MAVSMILLNLVIGVALLVGGLRHDDLRPNRTGVSAYLAMLIALSAVAFAFPGLIGVGGAYPAWQAVVIAVLTVLLYGFFLARQLGPQRANFQEVLPNNNQVAALKETLTEVIGVYLGLDNSNGKISFIEGLQDGAASAASMVYDQPVESAGVGWFLSENRPPAALAGEVPAADPGFRQVDPISSSGPDCRPPGSSNPSRRA